MAGSLSWLMCICLCPRLPAKPSLETQSDSETSREQLLWAGAIGISPQGQEGGSGRLATRWSRALSLVLFPSLTDKESSVTGRWEWKDPLPATAPHNQSSIRKADTFTRFKDQVLFLTTVSLQGDRREGGQLGQTGKTSAQSTLKPSWAPPQSPAKSPSSRL